MNLISLFRVGLLPAFMFCAFGISAQSELEKANKQFELRDYSAAISSYTELLKTDPNNALAATRLGESLYRTYKNGAAISVLTAAVELPTAPPMAAYFAGLALEQAGRYKDAQVYFAKFGRSNTEVGNRLALKNAWAADNIDNRSSLLVKPALCNTAEMEFGNGVWRNNFVFASTRQDIARKVNATNLNWTGNATTQLLQARILPEGETEKALAFRSDLKNKFAEGPVAFSGNGKMAAYTKQSFESGVRIFPLSDNRMSIYLSDVSTTGTLQSDKAFSHNIADFSTAFPWLSEDGKTMYFSSNRPGGMGGYDLYRSDFTAAGWSVPENLGAVVNTPGNEISPSMDKGILYYSSELLNGFGGQDVFSSSLGNSGFQAPINMGLGVNSQNDDFCFIFSSEKGLGFVSSNREGGKGLDDIYVVQSPKTKLNLLVADVNTRLPLANALVDLSGCGDLVYNTDKNGKLALLLDKKPCSGNISLDDYISGSFEFTPNSQLLNVFLQPTFVTLSGRLLDAKTEAPITNAAVKIQEVGTKNEVKTKTDKNGVFSIPVAIEKSYIVTYVADKYLSVTKPFAIERKPLDLGFQPLMIETKQPEPALVVAAVPKTSAPQKATAVPTTASQPEKVTPQIKQTETATTAATPVKPDPKTTSVAVKGYAIQLEASKPTEILDIDAYKSIATVGNMYVLPENGLSKLRLGVYVTRKQADEALSLIKAAGFTSAFIVPELNGDIAQKKKVTIPTAPKPGTVPELYSKGVAAPAFFTIRVGAFRQLSNVPMDKLTAVAPTFTEKKGKLTIVYVGAYPSEAAARAHLPLVKQLGFEEALVEETE